MWPFFLLWFPFGFDCLPCVFGHLLHVVRPLCLSILRRPSEANLFGKIFSSITRIPAALFIFILFIYMISPFVRGIGLLDEVNVWKSRKIWEPEKKKAEIRVVDVRVFWTLRRQHPPNPFSGRNSSELLGKMTLSCCEEKDIKAIRHRSISSSFSSFLFHFSFLKCFFFFSSRPWAATTQSQLMNY